MPAPDSVVPQLPDGQWIVDAYGFGDLVSWRLAARGAMGEVYQLVTTKAAYAAKVFFWEAPDEVRAGEVADFAAACRAAGVPSPPIERTRTGSAVCTSPVTGNVWQVQQWAPGRVPERDDVATAEWLAVQMAIIHQLALPCGDHAKLDGWYTRVAHDWAGLGRLSVASGMSWSDGIVRRRAEFEALSTVVNGLGVGELVQCHRDLKAVNTLVAGDGSRKLLDWDNCGPQQPWRELGAVLLHCAGDEAAVARIAAAYRRAGGPAWPETVELFATGLAVWLNFLHGQALVAMDPAADETHRAFAQETVSALVEGVPTLKALERAAEATRGAG